MKQKGLCMDEKNIEYIPDLRYTFQNFISINTNVEAKKAAFDFSCNQNLKQRILVISGEIGLGKTHLAWAIMNEMKLNNPNLSFYQINFEYIFKMSMDIELEDIFNSENYDKDSVILIDGFDVNSERYMRLRSRLIKLLRKLNPIVIFTSVKKMDINCIQIFLEPPNSNEDIRSMIKLGIEELNISLDNSIIEYLSQKPYDSVREIQGIVVSMGAASFRNPKIIDLAMAKKIYTKFRISNPVH